MQLQTKYIVHAESRLCTYGHFAVWPGGDGEHRVLEAGEERGGSVHDSYAREDLSGRL